MDDDTIVSLLIDEKAAGAQPLHAIDQQLFHIRLADSAGKEFSIPKAKIKRRAASTLSPMPSNFAETIAPQDLNDLLAFLLGS